MINCGRASLSHHPAGQLIKKNKRYVCTLQNPGSGQLPTPPTGSKSRTKASEPTEAQARSYRRALALLVKAGLVKRARKKDMVRNDLLKITDGGLAFGGWLLDPPRPTEEEHSRAMQEFGRVESRRAMVRTFAISAAGSKTANERLDRLLARMKTEGTE